MTKSSWLNLLKLLAPIIIPTIKPELASIADPIISAITEAEGLKNSKGSEKLKHVQVLANNAADIINIAKGSEVVDKANLDDAVDGAIKTTIAVVNLVSGKDSDNTT